MRWLIKISTKFVATILSGLLSVLDLRLVRPNEYLLIKIKHARSYLLRYTAIDRRSNEMPVKGRQKQRGQQSQRRR